MKAYLELHNITCMNINIISVVEFQKWWVQRSKDQKSTYSKDIIINNFNVAGG